jgi:predicted dehydrogenase
MNKAALRWDPRYAMVKAKLVAGGLGEPIHIAVRRNIPRNEGPGRYGGALALSLHVTVHDIDMISWLLQGRRLVHVYTQWTDKLLGELGTQDTLFAIVRYDDGTIANFASFWALPETSRTRLDARLEIVGTLGIAEVETGESGLHVADAGGAAFPDTQHWPEVNGRVLGDVLHELRAFVRDVQTGGTSCATGEEATETLRLTLAM